MDKPNYYAVIPAKVRYDESLKDKAKLLYGEIVALSNQSGECWATNGYFAKLYKVSNETISRLINTLIKNGYLESKFDKQVRILLPIDQIVNTPYQNNQGGIDEIVNHNNTSINNIKEISNNELLDTKKTLKKPTYEDVKTYCEERNNNVDAQLFVDFYESNGWKVGKNAMKDWKACIRTWERNNKSKHLDWQSQKMKQQEEAGRKFLEGNCD